MHKEELFRLKSFRKELGYKQADFAATLGIKQGSYSDIERGKTGISSDIIRRLVKKYRLNTAWLFDGIPPVQLPYGYLKEKEQATPNSTEVGIQEAPNPEADYADLTQLYEETLLLIDGLNHNDLQLVNELKGRLTLLFHENQKLRQDIIEVKGNNASIKVTLNKLFDLSKQI